MSHQSDLDLLEATPGIEPGIAVLQIVWIRPGPSASVRFEIKNGLILPLTCGCVRRSPPGLGSKLGSGWANSHPLETPNTGAAAHHPGGLVGHERPIRN